MLKDDEALRRQFEGDTDVFEKSIIDHWNSRPLSMKQVLLIEFAVWYDVKRSPLSSGKGLKQQPRTQATNTTQGVDPHTTMHGRRMMQRLKEGRRISGVCLQSIILMQLISLTTDAKKQKLGDGCLTAWPRTQKNDALSCACCSWCGTQNPRKLLGA